MNVHRPDPVDRKRNGQSLPRVFPARPLGAATDGSRLTIVEVPRRPWGGRPIRISSVDLDPNAEDPARALSAAMQECPGVDGAERDLDFALGGAGWHIRAGELPPVGRAARRQLLERNAKRFFPTMAPVLADAEAPKSKLSRGSAPSEALAVAADAQRVLEVEGAAEAAGMRLRTVTTFPQALAAGASTLVPRERGRGVVVVARVPEGWIVVFTRAGRVVYVRRIVLAKDDESMPAYEDGAAGGRLEHLMESLKRLTEILAASPVETVGRGLGVIVVGDSDCAGELRDQLSAATLPAGFDPLEPGRASELDPLAIAAIGSTRVPLEGLSLSSPARRMRLATAARRRTRALLSAAAGLLLLAGGFQHLRTEQALRHVLDQRATIAPLVAEATALGEAVDSLEFQVALIESVIRARPPWTARLATLASELPADARLIGLRGTASEWQIDGVAVSVDTVVNRLAAADGFAPVRLLGHAERESDLGSVEVFTIAFTGSTAVQEDIR